MYPVREFAPIQTCMGLFTCDINEDRDWIIQGGNDGIEAAKGLCLLLRPRSQLQLKCYIVVLLPIAARTPFIGFIRVSTLPACATTMRLSVPFSM